MFFRFVLATVVCVSLYAQADRGTITGTVADPQGGVVPQAKIGLRNTQTGSQFETVTTPTGNYSLGQLPAGTYDLSVEYTGFKKFTQKGIVVQVAQTERVDVPLEVGSTADAVTITADATQLKTETAEQSHNITTERMNALPLNFGSRGAGTFRDALAFVQIIPGASISDRNTIRINGQPNSTFTMRLEGQDSSHTLDPTQSDVMTPSVESLQETSVQTSNFAAEYGQVVGGQFNFTTKSGTNQLHGSLYGYFVNEQLHAGKPFTDDGSGNHIRAKDRKQDSGGSIGGPIFIPKVYDGRNKTFFFFNVEKYINRGNIAGSFLTVPTPQFRNGDFSAVLTGRQLGTDPLGRAIMENTIYDPSFTYTASNGQLVRDPFPGNQIPVTRFDPVSAKIQALVPLPTRSGLTQNFLQNASTVRKNEIGSIKIDHSVSEKSKISFYIHRFRTKFGNNGADGLPVPISGKRLGSNHIYESRLNYDYTLTPRMILHLGAGIVTEVIPDEPIPGVVDFDQATIGLTGAISKGFPRISGLSQGNFGGMSGVIGAGAGNKFYTIKPTGVASVTYVRNNHTYKLGSEWRIDGFTNKSYLAGLGSYSFSNQQTTLPSTQGQSLGGGSVGHGYASFLLGGVSSASIGNQQDPQYRRTSFGLFLQDSWKVTRKLSLDYGLRWDYQTALREIWDRTSGFDPAIPNPSAGGLLGATVYEGFGPGRCNCTLSNTYPYAIGPRLGGAYQLNGKTVLRAGIGVTYGQPANFNYMGTTVGTGYNTLNFSSTSFGDPALLLRNGLQYNPNLLYASNLDPGIRPSPGQIDTPSPWIDPNGGRPSRSVQWSVGVQREVGRNLVVEASYVGNRGAWYQANNLIEINSLTPERLALFGLNIANAADRTLLTSRLDSATAAARGFNKIPYAGYSTGNTVAQSLRAFPQFQGLSAKWSPLGRAWYDSLQVKATKRYSYGLDFTFAFTWQKELSSGADDQNGGSGGTNDVFNRANQKYISPSSQPLVTVISFDYRTPSWNKNRVLRFATGGWTISGIMRYASGVPIGVPGSQNALTSLLFRGTRMNRVADQPLFLVGGQPVKDLNCGCFDPYKDLVLNPKAWQDAAAGQWGVSAAYYNDYRQQRHPDEQLSVGRSFRIREGVAFSFRGEFFNAFNRKILTGPSSGNPTATTTTDSRGLSGGFGFINPLNSGTPRNGQVVLRLQF